MKKLFASVITALFVFCFAAYDSNAQEIYKIGDTVYVNAYFAGCVKATVLKVEPPYYVHIEEGSYKGQDTFYSANRIGDCKQTPAGTKTTTATGNPNVAANIAVGSRVDVYLSGGQEGKNRGTVIDSRPSEFKVHYDGCSEKFDVWENASFLRPAAEISTDDSKIKFLIGKWSMTSVGISSAAIALGKAPGIQINADGTYTWHQGAGKPAVNGHWRPHAKIEGARYGTETEDGVIIKDAAGTEWKLYRRKSTADNDDHITIHMMCQGLTQIGTRVH